MLSFFSKKNNCKDKALAKTLHGILGFKPKNVTVYALALTHKSAINIKCQTEYENNERLEFLGDAILDAVISELLYSRFPTADEGFLTQMRTKIVNGKKLSELAAKIGLKKIIHANTNISPKIYEDAFEALIGAIFLDRGYNYVKEFVFQKIMINLINLNELRHEESNYKSKIIEWVQKYKKTINFSTELESPDSRTFISRITIGDEMIASGKGRAKKEAEQNAAHKALKIIENREKNG